MFIQKGAGSSEYYVGIHLFHARYVRPSGAPLFVINSLSQRSQPTHPSSGTVLSANYSHSCGSLKASLNLNIPRAVLATIMRALEVINLGTITLGTIDTN